MKRIIYTNEDGGCSVIIPAPDCGLTIEQIMEKDAPTGSDAVIVDASAIPSDRTFRNAWEKSGNGVQHNMVKAALIAHERRRTMRAEELAPLDQAVNIAIVGKPAEAQAAEAARQVIRDKYAAMQTAIDAAQNVDELKAALGLQP